MNPCTLYSTVAHNSQLISNILQLLLPYTYADIQCDALKCVLEVQSWQLHYFVLEEATGVTIETFQPVS